MEEDGKEEMMVVEEARGRDKTVLMWGYLPGVSPQRSPLLHPVAVRVPDSPAGDRWKDVSGGGCGFAMAISGIGRYFYYLIPSACAFCLFRFVFGLLLSESQRPCFLDVCSCCSGFELFCFPNLFCNPHFQGVDFLPSLCFRCYDELGLAHLDSLHFWTAFFPWLLN